MNDNDRAQQEELIFAQAVQVESEAERSAYLDEACRGQPELRQRLELLLEGYFRSPGFLDDQDPGPVKTNPAIRGAAVPEEEIGAIIGRYKLLEKVGEGGFGAVYVAEQREPVKRRVAFKIIKLGMDTKQVTARFEAERQALALMEHPNIAKVLDAGATETGRPYFVMELVRGVRITDYCDENSLPTNERLDLFMQVCHAIQHAHQKGIIHRDIKPSNILVTVVDGRPVPKVIDFGIAKATHGQLADQTVYTQLHQFIGTPAYMSPEQAMLSGVDVDTRSDIYSLGVLLYEMLTGHTPFDLKTLLAAGLDEMRRVIREQEPPRPSTRISTLDDAERTTVAKHRQTEPAGLSRLVRGDLDWIAMKCLEKERGRRYETANALALDIEHHLNQEPVSAAAPGALYRCQKFVRRNKSALGVASVLALLLVTGTVVSTWQAVRATRAEASEKAQRLRAETEKERADAKTKEAEAHANQIGREKEMERFNRYVAQTALVQQEMENGKVGLALNLLEGLRPKQGEEDLRGFEWYYLWRQCNRGLLATLRGLEDSVEALAFSPDGATLVSASGDGTIASWIPSRAVEHEILGKLPAGLARAEFSRDGKMLAWGSTNGTITVWDVNQRAERVNIRAHATSVCGLAFSPDSRSLASAGKDGMVRVWEVSTGEAEGPGWNQPYSSSTIAFPEAIGFSPDGSLLAANYREAINIYDLGTRQLRQTLAGHRLWIKCLAFLPDGKTLVSGGYNRTIKFWDLTSGQERTALERTGGMSMTALAVSPDGTRLALGHEDGTVEVCDLASGQTRRYCHSARVCALAFSPGGNRLASSSRDLTIKLWDLEAATDLPAPARQEHRVWRVPFSPDGRLLVWSREGGETKVMDVATSQELAVFGDFTIAAAFSPDGRTLALWENSTPGNRFRLYDVGTWQPRAVFGDQDGFVGAVVFAPDGKSLAWAHHGGTICWSDLAANRRWTASGHHAAEHVFSIALSADGSSLASASLQDVVLWDVASGKERARLPRANTCVAFSPDGKTLASRLLDGDVGLWDATTGRRKAEMSGPVKAGLFMVFMPDGKTLASCNNEASITLWDTVRGQQRATLQKPYTSVYSLAVSPDGRTIATGGVYGDLELWRAADEGEVTAQRPSFEHLLELAGESIWHGLSWQDRGRDTEAQEAYLHAVGLYESVAAQSPGRSEYERGLLVAYRRWFKLVAESTQLAAQDRGWALAWADKALALAGDKPSALPERVAICCDKAKLLERVGKTNEALTTFDRAIEWGSADTNACVSMLADARLGRRRLLLRMNGPAAGADEHLRYGLILHFTFDQEWTDGKVIDASGNENHGWVFGATWEPGGRRGGAARFAPPNQFIVVSNSAPLNPPQLTVAAWVKTSRQDDIWRRVVDKDWRTGFALSVGGMYRGNARFKGKVTMEIAMERNNMQGITTSAGIVTDGKWHHLAATYDGADQSLYVDGIRQPPGVHWGGAKPANSHDLTIGIDLVDPEPPEAGASFDGLIDEVMLFSRALSPEEIASLAALPQ